MDTGHQCYCQRWFATEHAYFQHCDALGHWDNSDYDEFVCEECNRSFADEHALNQHCDALGHWDASSESCSDDDEFFCRVCNRSFVDEHALDQHCEALGHFDEDADEYFCRHCDRSFISQDALNQHCDAVGHGDVAPVPSFPVAPIQAFQQDYPCCYCDRSFASQQALNQHCDALGHWDRVPILFQNLPPIQKYQDEYACSYCDRSFGSQQALDQHNAALHHGSTTYNSPNNGSLAVQSLVVDGRWSHYQSNGNLHCMHCAKAFHSWDALQMQIKSPIHRCDGLDCPFCRQNLASAAGVAHHLEMGHCPSGKTTRDGVYNLVLSKDPKGLITKNILQWGLMEYSATSQSWNGSGYEYYLCHGAFSKLDGLNQHLNSPVHEQALYHCPTKTCGDFKTLGAILQHLESESCGVTRFATVQNTISDVIGHGNLLKF